jgi:hypothetical protein
MNRCSTLLLVLSNLFLCSISTVASGREPQVEVEWILQTTQTWDKSSYKNYPTGNRN